MFWNVKEVQGDRQKTLARMRYKKDGLGFGIVVACQDVTLTGGLTLGG